MTINAVIKNALDSLGDPVEFEVYSGKSPSYYVFNYTTQGANYADDAPWQDRYLVQVHFFCPLGMNILPRIRETRRRLFAAGLTFPSVVNASDETARHVVFECEYSEGVDAYGLLDPGP